MADGFRTDRMDVVPWHELPNDTLTTLVVGLLTPAVTADLPPSWATVADQAAAAAWIDERDDESIVLAAVERSDDRPLGLLIVSGDTEVRIGYLLAERAWGRGFATELLAGWVRTRREEGSTAEVVAGVTADNVASRRVLERSGFNLNGVTSEGVLEYRLTVSDGANETDAPTAR